VTVKQITKTLGCHLGYTDTLLSVRSPLLGNTFNERAARDTYQHCFHRSQTEKHTFRTQKLCPGNKNVFDFRRRFHRVVGRGGEICVYLNNAMPCKRRLDLENPIFECLWLILRPKRLPRPLSGIAICVVYHPQVDLLKVIKD